jgi:multiple sugar transport system ATP-binding protein
VNNARKDYGAFKAIKGVSVDIRDGEFVVLVGPSGCGKSTTLRMIAGLEEITSGEISIGGEVVNDLPPKDRDIAMVFQNYALYPHMTSFENMAFGLKLRKFPKAEIKQRVEHAARILDITELLERRPKALSGGQRQRVAMGRAIVRNPKVFLFDEPLSNLDAKLRVQMRTEIKRVHQKVKTTTVYVTHDQVEAMTLADRVVVMNNGIIAATIFAFTVSWAAFVYPMTFLYSSDQQVLTVGTVTSLIRADVYKWGMLMAGALVAAAPPLIIYAFLMDYYIAGLTAGATKG